MRALRAFGEADDVARPQLALTLRVTQRRPAGNDHQPLLGAVLVV